ncbi:cell division protein ZapB [Desulfobacterales bacterium HSG2]|nr:cell division protein ZapB [Desulfobacterales bacterium HSG2]
MENEKILRQFEEVEKKVEKLIGRCKSLESDNSKLTNKINQLEQELQKKAEMENRNVEEKTFIRSKIDGLLAKLKES